MDRTTPELSEREEVETAAAVAVGQIVLALSRLEFNIGLYLRNAIAGGDPESVNQLINRLSFKGKTDSLHDLVFRRFSNDSECLASFRTWRNEIDRVRAKRNAFVHGRWGVNRSAKTVVNVAPGLPGNTPQAETHYTLASLTNELATIESAAKAFYKWAERWPL